MPLQGGPKQPILEDKWCYATTWASSR